MWSSQDSFPRHVAINFDWVAKLESYHGAKSKLDGFEQNLIYKTFIYL